MKSLYESLQKRDAASWDEFYEEHARELYGFVFRLVRGDPQSAADVFQDIWLDAISHIGQFDPKCGELRSWLFGIARRRVARHWRQRLARSGMAAAAPACPFGRRAPVTK
jgi:RNA polymerase sigma-70 factor (ECF subfamily)